VHSPKICRVRDTVGNIGAATLGTDLIRSLHDRHVLACAKESGVGRRLSDRSEFRLSSVCPD
jgi:hypothetical protein